MIQGKKTKIAAACMAIGGVGLILNGDVVGGITAIVQALAVFGLGDKVDRLLKALKEPGAVATPTV